MGDEGPIDPSACSARAGSRRPGDAADDEAATAARAASRPRARRGCPRAVAAAHAASARRAARPTSTSTSGCGASCARATCCCGCAPSRDVDGAAGRRGGRLGDRCCTPPRSSCGARGRARAAHAARAGIPRRAAGAAERLKDHLLRLRSRAPRRPQKILSWDEWRSEKQKRRAEERRARGALRAEPTAASDDAPSRWSSPRASCSARSRACSTLRRRPGWRPPALPRAAPRQRAARRGTAKPAGRAADADGAEWAAYLRDARSECAKQKLAELTAPSRRRAR